MTSLKTGDRKNPTNVEVLAN